MQHHFFLFNQNFFLMLPIIFTLQAKLLKFSLHSYIIAVRRVYLVGINWTHPNYALIHAKQDRRERKKFSFFLFTGTWWWKSALHWSRSLHLYREDYGAQHWPQGKFEIQMMQFRNSHQMHWNLLRENRSQNFLITSRLTRETKVSISIWSSTTSKSSRSIIWFMHEVVSEKFFATMYRIWSVGLHACSPNIIHHAITYCLYV